MKVWLLVIFLVSVILISGCTTELGNTTNVTLPSGSSADDYVAIYQVDEGHIIAIAKIQDERDCSFCMVPYLQNACYGDCIQGKITESVIEAYKETYNLTTASVPVLVDRCISHYKPKEGFLFQYTDVETRCIVCDGSLDCHKLENEYVYNETTKKFELGNPIEHKKFKFALISAQKLNLYHYTEWTDYGTEYNYSVKPETGKIFVLADIELRSIPQKLDDSYFDPALIVIKDSLNNSYEPEPLYNSGLGGVVGHFNRGKGGFPKEGDRGKLLFEVPKNATLSEIQYDLSKSNLGNGIVSYGILYYPWTS